MTIKPLLRRLIVIRRYDERRIRAEFFRRYGVFHGLARAVRAGAGHHFHAPLCKLNGEFDDAEMFIVIKCGRLASRAHGHDSSDSTGDLRLDERGERGFIHTVIAKWRYERRISSCKHRAAGFRRRERAGQREM